MPGDDAGYIGRECPACSRFFKLMISEYEALPDEMMPTCPYCGHCAETSSFMSEAQRSRVKAGAMALAEQFVHSELNDMMRRTFRSSQHVKITHRPGMGPPRRSIPTYVEDAVRRTIECKSCGNHQAVYGASAFCYVCGPRDAAATVIEELVSERHALALEDQLDAERREDARALGVFDGLVADAVQAVVTEFEVYAREEFSQRVSNADAAAKAAGGNVFQRLDDASALFAQHAGFALSSLVSGDTWARLQRAFEQRHVFTHKDGHVDQRYLDRVPDCGLALGQRLVVSRADAEQALEDLELLIGAVEAK